LTLLVSYPHIHWVFIYQTTDKQWATTDNFDFDDVEIKAALGDMSMTEPDILKICARHDLKKAFNHLRIKQLTKKEKPCQPLNHWKN
jgi:hypothetical protein